MKKIIIGLAIATAAFVSNAEYLYWGVTSSEVGSYNAARLMYSSSQDDMSSSQQIGVLYDLPGSTKTSISTISNYQGLYYFVELANYENGTWTTDSASSTVYSYDSLVAAGVISSSELIAQASVMTAVLTRNGVQATPEPTSGLLLLMGFAMLGLKRKKEV
ncbi:MAG: PEP-CTERM sorting domain-containing protein [Kiritimatiellae bacterium]|nr:PEP-CTERM sorting domain-containing protein [Kiritimatiellia bacterium]